MTHLTTETSFSIAPSSLAARLEENYLSWFLDLDHIPGVRVSSGRAFTAVLSRKYPHPLVNAVLRTGFPPGDELFCVQDLHSVFSGNQVPYRYFFGPSQSAKAPIARALELCGRNHAVDLPTLWMEFADIQGPISERLLPSGLRIERVQNESQRDEWVAVMLAGFDLPKELAPLFRDFISMQGLGPYTRFPCFIGYSGKHPVAISAYYVAAETVSLPFVTTLPNRRQRGYATAMSWACIRRARERDHGGIGGYASPMGEPIYRRIGFQDIGQVTEIY